MANVFYPPTVVALPPPQPALRVAALRLMISTLTTSAALLTATWRTAGYLVSFGRHICSIATRAAAMSWRQLGHAMAAISSLGRAVARPAFIVGRAAAVIVPCLVIYTALAMTPANHQARTDRASIDRAPDAPKASVAAGMAAISPVALAAPVAPESKGILSAPANVRIVDAPFMDASCDEQTWPYVTQRCLAARTGQIELTSDPGVAALNAARDAIASSDAKAAAISKDVVEETSSTPVKKRKARRAHKRHR